jgi:hypothetical protein
MTQIGSPGKGEPMQENSNGDGKPVNYPASAAPATAINKRRISDESAREIGNLVRLLAVVGQPEEALGVVSDLGEVLAAAGLDFKHLAAGIERALRGSP